MQKQQAKSDQGRFMRPRKKTFLFLSAILLSVFLVMELIGWSGQIQFYSKWIECGQKPLRAKGSGFMNAGAIHYAEMPSVNVWMPAGEYFCTPLEAERAGYSSSPNQYEFPHLEKARAEGLAP